MLSLQIWINTKEEKQETKRAFIIRICLHWVLFITWGKGEWVSLPRGWSRPWARLTEELLQLGSSRTKWKRESACQSKQRRTTATTKASRKWVRIKNTNQSLERPRTTRITGYWGGQVSLGGYLGEAFLYLDVTALCDMVPGDTEI